MQTAELVAGPELDALVAEKFEMWYGFDPQHRDPPHFSTDIVLAFQVAERLQSEWGPLTLVGSYRGDEWSACFGHQLFYGAETAPLAICRAALAAVSH